MNITRNGAAEAIVLGDSQLGALSLGLAAYDAQIGMGSITLPGNPGWLAGDRICAYESGPLIYTGYVMDRGRRRGVERADFETTYQLMDLNRQLVGRMVIDWDRPEETASERLDAFILAFLSDLTLDVTWVETSAVVMAPKLYTGDGIMDLLADLILYTGKTLFLAPKSDTEFELHFHDLLDGVVAGIAASDNMTNPLPAFSGGGTVTWGGDPVTWGGEIITWGGAGSGGFSEVVPLRDPAVDYSASDVKNDYVVRNGVAEFPVVNPASLSAHGAGGLKFEAVLDYGGVNLDTLALIGTNLLYTAAYPKASYSCVLGPLTGAQVAALPPGAMFIVESTVMDLLGGGIVRISSIDLTATRDEAGQPMPGLWDAALQLSYPQRLPAAIVGYGAQGGDLGRLSQPKTWVDTEIEYDDPDIPVGSNTTVTAQLVDEDGVAVPVPDVQINWSIEQFSDEAGTVPTTDYSLSDTDSPTDISGRAEIVVTHDTDAGGTIKWWVEGGP